jgi:hypothetical protein
MRPKRQTRSSGPPRPMESKLRTPRLRRRQSDRAFRAHRKAHEAVLGNAAWYGDGGPNLGASFTAKETAQRHRIVVEILLRAASRAAKAGDQDLARAYQDLADKLSACRRRARCGSLACPMCCRAFQRAKTVAERATLKARAKAAPDKNIVFVTIIPAALAFRSGKLNKLEITKANRWLKDRLDAHRIRRRMLGSGDVGWETRRDKSGYWQYHWHFATLTRKTDRLEQKLKAVFPRARKYERPVDVTEMPDLGFLGYLNKGLKLPDLLRRARNHLPELLLLLDQTDPMDLMVLRGFRVRVENGGFALRPIRRNQRKQP